MNLVIRRTVFNALLILTTFACDPVVDDVQPQDQPSSVSVTYYVLEGTSILLDMNKLFSGYWDQVSIRVRSVSGSGELKPYDESLWLFDASRLKPGHSTFALEGSRNGTIVNTFTIDIEVVSEGLGCNGKGPLVAIQDVVLVKPNSTTTIDVLRNDLRCEVFTSTIEIYKQPLYGNAFIEDDEIQYVPGVDFGSSDTLIYKVNGTQNPDQNLTAYGLVILRSEAECPWGFESEYTVDLGTAPRQWLSGVYEYVIVDLNPNPLCGDIDFSIVSQTSEAGSFIFTYYGIFYHQNDPAVFANETLIVQICESQTGCRNITYHITSDPGGNVWVPITIPGVMVDDVMNPQIPIEFIDDNKGFYGGRNRFIKTDNHGLSWKSIQIEETTDNWAVPLVDFIDDNNGFLVYEKCDQMWKPLERRLMKTNDGGNSWETVNSSFPGNDLKFISGAIGFSMRYRTETDLSALFRTDDGGITWHESSLPEDVIRLIGYNVGSDGVGYGGYNGKTGGVLIKTTDWGETWEPIRYSEQLGSFHYNGEAIYFSSVKADPQEATFWASYDGINFSVLYRNESYGGGLFAFAPDNSSGVHLSYDSEGAILFVSNDGKSWVRSDFVFSDGRRYASLSYTYPAQMMMPSRNTAYAVFGGEMLIGSYQFLFK